MNRYSAPGLQKLLRILPRVSNRLSKYWGRNRKIVSAVYYSLTERYLGTELFIVGQFSQLLIISVSRKVAALLSP